MDEMLEKYFLRKEKEKREERNKLLISEGLYKYEYSEVFKTDIKVPIEVTDDEYLKILECSSITPVHDTEYDENIIARVMRGSAVILFILNFIGSMFISALTTHTSYYSGKTYTEIDFNEFNWTVFLSLVLISFFGCLLMYAVGEIVDKLDRIEKKNN